MADGVHGGMDAQGAVTVASPMICCGVRALARLDASYFPGKVC
jgi:hypothetical protein